ncbi:PREDICTED: uncharacterized protein LOC105600841 [Cercocebus atys]|uniref:uncharacterized protein LOC105600841 n=1 Tax=Cercocebus atys TaxID=9531 RepID=UPI0005F4D23C|nr:PREDICTED: uncharacterized protein LOC105600841 [Cercocebus atys]
MSETCQALEKDTFLKGQGQESRPTLSLFQSYHAAPLPPHDPAHKGTYSTTKIKLVSSRLPRWVALSVPDFRAPSSLPSQSGLEPAAAVPYPVEHPSALCALSLRASPALGLESSAQCTSRSHLRKQRLQSSSSAGNGADSNSPTSEADWLRWGYLVACKKRVVGKARPRERAHPTHPQRSSLTPQAGPCLTDLAAHGGPCLLLFSGFPQSRVLESLNESERVLVAGRLAWAGLQREQEMKTQMWEELRRWRQSHCSSLSLARAGSGGGSRRARMRLSSPVHHGWGGGAEAPGWGLQRAICCSPQEALRLVGWQMNCIITTQNYCVSGSSCETHRWFRGMEAEVIQQVSSSSDI